MSNTLVAHLQMDDDVPTLRVSKTKKALSAIKAAIKLPTFKVCTEPPQCTVRIHAGHLSERAPTAACLCPPLSVHQSKHKPTPYYEPATIYDTKGDVGPNPFVDNFALPPKEPAAAALDPFTAAYLAALAPKQDVDQAAPTGRQCVWEESDHMVEEDTWLPNPFGAPFSPLPFAVHPTATLGRVRRAAFKAVRALNKLAPRRRS
jgi:hypothetical protein